MSNDLISRNALIDVIYGKDYFTDTIKEVLKDIINNQPTATDKVVEQLEHLDIYYDNDYFTSNRKPMWLKEDVLEVMTKKNRSVTKNETD